MEKSIVKLEIKIDSDDEEEEEDFELYLSEPGSPSKKPRLDEYEEDEDDIEWEDCPPSPKTLFPVMADTNNLPEKSQPREDLLPEAEGVTINENTQKQRIPIATFDEQSEYNEDYTERPIEDGTRTKPISYIPPPTARQILPKTLTGKDISIQEATELYGNMSIFDNVGERGVQTIEEIAHGDIATVTKITRIMTKEQRSLLDICKMAPNRLPRVRTTCVRRSYDADFLREPDIQAGERLCANEQLCMASRYLKWPDDTSGFPLREYILPKQNEEEKLSGNLPEQPRECLVCQLVVAQRIVTEQVSENHRADYTNIAVVSFHHAVGPSFDYRVRDCLLPPKPNYLLRMPVYSFCISHFDAKFHFGPSGTQLRGYVNNAPLPSADEEPYFPRGFLVSQTCTQ